MSDAIIDINAQYGIDGQDFLIKGDAAIAQALTRILTTQATSRFMRPQLRSPIWDHLFREITEDNAFLLMVALFDLLQAREPRIAVDKEHCRIVADTRDRLYHVLISYKNVTNNNQGSVTFSLKGGA